MQKTLPLQQQPSCPPPPPPSGQALQRAVLKWLQDRPRGTPDALKTTFNQNTPEALADALKALQHGGQITILEEDGIPQFVGARCTMCQSLIGYNPACKANKRSPKQGWACRDYTRRVQKYPQKDAKDADQPDDGNQLFERLMQK